MLQNYNRYKVLKVFLDSPTQEFGLREISRLIYVAPASVLNYLREFEEDNLIRKLTSKNRPVYKAERENETFILYKKLSIVYELHNSGLIAYLWEQLAPKALILYGSQAKGEATEQSDIDIFVIGKEHKIELEKFEKMFGREIQLMFEKNFEKISKELKNNLINGVILKGYLRLFHDTKN